MPGVPAAAERPSAICTPVQEPLVLPLCDATDEAIVGGKARNLARLIRNGHAVPDGFVLTDAAWRLFAAESDLTPVIETMTAHLDPKSPAGLRSASETIAAFIRQAPIPSAIHAALAQCHAELGAGPLIVRSSAIGEDSRDASFAGQLDSIADVQGAAFLALAALDVWASRWSARALAYQLRRGVPLTGMGIVVQRQIASRISGVLFTIAPDEPGAMLIEYCTGTGEALVSGRENPGRIRVARDSRRWQQIAALEQRSADEALLVNDRAIGALGRSALAIEHAFGAPQDIEWTIDPDGRIWIVQARPITVASGASVTGDIPGAEAVHWSNANVNENFPAPISPLLYSIAATGYYNYFRNLGRAFGLSSRRLAAMERPLREIIGVHAGRMYYNLTSIHGILRSAPFGELLTGSFNQFVGADATAAAPAAGRFGAGRRAISQALETAVIAVKVWWQYASLTQRVEEFEQTIDAFARRTDPAVLPGRALHVLIDDFRAALEIRNDKWTNAALADAASMVCYGVLQRLLARAYPSADRQVLHNSLLKALPGLVSSKPAAELWRLSRIVRANPRLHTCFEGPADRVLRELEEDAELAPFRKELDAYLNEWGFRCSGELMLTMPSFQEEPWRIVDLVKTYAAMDGESPADILARQESERMRETGRVARELRGQRFFTHVPLLHTWLVVSRVLRWTQHAILLRERARLKQALLYSRIRRVALTIGARFVELQRVNRADDVFFLTEAEVQSLAGGTSMFPDSVPALVALRREALENYARTTPPDAMTLRRGEYLPGVAFDAAAQDPVEPQPADPRGETLRGLGACGGTATARAAILLDVAEAHLLSPGDILVTKQTDPGWGPLFPLVSGLVIERGGMLSHGAIIAREFGIPSVVGVADATRRIAHGSRIRVDGDRGRVSSVGPCHAQLQPDSRDVRLQPDPDGAR